MSKIIGKVPLVFLSIIWLVGIDKLIGKYNWNLISMYTASNSFEWRGFVILFLAFSIFLGSWILGYRNDDELQQETNEE